MVPSDLSVMHRRVIVLCICSLSVSACRATQPTEPASPEPAVQLPEIPTLAPEANPIAAVEPACTVTLDADGQLTVRGRVIPSDGFWRPALVDRARVRSFPYRADAILFALGTNFPWWPDADDYPSSTLWELPCDRPEAMRPFEQIEGADFSWAEMEPDGSALYFSFGEVQRYDVAQRTYGPVTSPPRITNCWMQAEGSVLASEYVAGWIGDRLLIYWGGPCGFEAEWEGGTAVIEDPRGAATRRASAYVGAIAEVDGQVWVGNGGSCATQPGAWDASKPGIWRSEDLGESWTFVPLGQLPRGVEAIATNDGRVTVQAGCCYAGAYDECESQRLISDDGGHTWTPDPSGQAPLEPGPRSLTIGEWVFEATRDGVTKRRADEPGGASATVLLPGID